MSGKQTPVKRRQKADPSEAKTQAGNWQRMWFKNNKVWLAAGSDGKPLVQKGKVLIKYQLNQDYEWMIVGAAIIAAVVIDQTSARLLAKR